MSSDPNRRVMMAQAVLAPLTASFAPLLCQIASSGRKELTRINKQRRDAFLASMKAPQEVAEKKEQDVKGVILVDSSGKILKQVEGKDAVDFFDDSNSKAMRMAAMALNWVVAGAYGFAVHKTGEKNFVRRPIKDEAGQRQWKNLLHNLSDLAVWMGPSVIVSVVDTFEEIEHAIKDRRFEEVQKLMDVSSKLKPEYIQTTAEGYAKYQVTNLEDLPEDDQQILKKYVPDIEHREAVGNEQSLRFIKVCVLTFLAGAVTQGASIFLSQNLGMFTHEEAQELASRQE